MIGPIEVKAPEAAPAPVPAPPKPKAEFSEPKRPWWWRWSWPPSKKRAEYAEPWRRPAEHQDDADILIDKAEAANAEAMDALLEPVRALVANAASFAEILDGLADLYPDMDAQSFAKTLETAVAAANLAGAATVKTGTGAAGARPSGGEGGSGGAGGVRGGEPPRAAARGGLPPGGANA
jgi:hypothetical protein